MSVQIIAWGVLLLWVWMAGVVLRWPVLWRDAGALLALAPAIGLTLVPVTAEYWLPTVSWPWWPGLSALVLAVWPGLATGWRVVTQWVVVRPIVSWIGLAAALASLLALRTGAPAWVTLPLVLGGVGLAWPLIADSEERSAWPIGGLLAAMTVVALVVRLVALDQMPPAL